MKIIPIVISTLLACNIAHARIEPKQFGAEPQTNGTKSTFSNLIPAPRYGGTYRPVTTMLSLVWGQVTSTVVTDTASYKGSSQLYRIGLGAKFLLPGSCWDNNKFFTVSLAYTTFTSRYSYPKGGKDITSSTEVQCVSLPVTIGFMKKPGKVGYYGQAGVTFNYNAQVKPDYKALVWDYNKLWVDPSVSLGICADIVARKGGVESEPYRLAIGPYVGYAINNLSGEQNISLQLFQVGVRFTAARF